MKEEGVQGYSRLHGLDSLMKLRHFKKKANKRLFLLGLSRFNFLILHDLPLFRG